MAQGTHAQRGGLRCRGLNRRAVVRVAAWPLLACLASAPAAPAAQSAETPVPGTDARAVRGVIEAQLAAFAAGNAELAFSYASSGLRTQFGDAKTFMTMVLTGYPMVLRPAAIAFFQPRAIEGAVWQTVQLRDRDGSLWLAHYQLLRQPGVGWRIGGCTVVSDPGKSTT